MINLSFTAFAEQKPAHQQEIVFIDNVGGILYDAVSIFQGTVYYEWLEVDENDEPTGTSAGYCNDEQEPGWILVYYISKVDGGTINTTDSTHWMDYDCYWDNLKNSGIIK